MSGPVLELRCGKGEKQAGALETMLRAFLFTHVAVIVRHWFEIGLADGVMEHGVRLELRLLGSEPHRGTESAAQKFVIDRPVWRADLFDRLDQPAGTFSAAHYHPTFEENEPCARVFRPEVNADPWSWAMSQLSDIGALCEANLIPAEAVSVDIDAVGGQARQIIELAQSLAPKACTSADQCFRWTSDIAETVQLMVKNMDDPSMLDQEYTAPWLGESLHRPDHRA